MRIAIIGAGVSGIYAAHKLASEHDVTLYEANGYLGGHTDTHHITVGERVCSVDTGFIVFNQQNYPLFDAFLNELGVKSQPSNMSFSVSDLSTNLEYNAGSIAGLFCQYKNITRPGFYRMLFDILRFYKRCPALLDVQNDDMTIDSYLRAESYSAQFINNHIIPMAGALWSSPPSTVSQFPARYFVAFMHNHQMLQISNRPVWRTISGGSSQYVKAFEKKFSGRLVTACPVKKVDRTVRGVLVHTSRSTDHHDLVIIACHSNQALALLSDANDRERALLSAIHYQENEIVLHTDSSVMPANPRAWASWNVTKPVGNNEGYIVTYYMNMLQNIDFPKPLLVTLNASPSIDKDKILLCRQYDHPVYTPESLRAQKELRAQNGLHNTYFAGAYLGWGFHEDGIASAQRVVDAITEGSLARAA